MFKKLSLIVLLLLATSCDRDTIINLPDNPVAPTGTNIEFRVNGNAVLARIRYSTPIDGLTFVNTSLPYTINFNTTATTLFLSVEATPTQYPFNVTIPYMQVQIFVNGNLFREASSSDFSLNTVSASGTWRR
jgi:hypothetical protein